MAKGGGAWKVAYADFVTAMMAFFLVMWICSQDQKIKQSVARYFVTPMGLVETGVSKRPNHAGALMPAINGGSVPTAESVSLGRGRLSHTRPENDHSSPTRVIGEWLQTSDMENYWHAEIDAARDHAAMVKDLLKTPGSTEERATLDLSRKLREQISRRVHSDQGELAHELLSQVLADVNWTELAEDMLANQGAAKPASAKVSRRDR